MTYTHKLARRLAISRNLAMLHVLVLFAACAGETTAPEVHTSPTSPATPSAPVGFRVLPGTVTIETEQRIRFRGELHSLTGKVATPELSWETSGGSIDASGNFSADQPGTYRIVGRGRGGVGRGRSHFHRPDTSVVVVVVKRPGLAELRVTPRDVMLQPGETHSFTVMGRLRNGKQAPIGVVWTATGGAIDPAGTYQAGSLPGRFIVVATNTQGTIADTVAVVITAPVPDGTPAPSDSTPPPTPDPDPTPDPEPTVVRVVLRPASVVLATSATHQFAAFGRTSTSDSVAVDVTFHATGGSITPTGLYTADATPGTFSVIARSDQLADTAVVTLTRSAGGGTPEPTPGGRSISFGPYGAWAETASLKTNTAVFTGTIGSVSASALVGRIGEARRRGVALMTAMTGGHKPYLTDGVFDMAKWKAKMDTYNTPTIKQAVAAATADGTLIGNSVMDEPHVYGQGDGNTWGPKGTMTKARVDEMCRYVKAMFPTLPVGVVHQHSSFEPDKSYQSCDFIVSQYSHRYGDVTKFRDDALAMGRRDGIAIAFSLNIINGGIQAARDGQWNCPLTTTGGRGTYDPNCRMTAAQVRDYGLLLGPAGCAMMMWRYDAVFMANPGNQQAFAEIAKRLATQPARPCTRT
jgi:hypothetical protein